MVISQKTPVKKWTWADLQSSYRFWGLVFYFVAFGFSQYFFSTAGLLFIKANSDLSMTDIGTVHATQQAGLFFGAILAWVASRIKNYYMLYLFSGLVLLGFSLFSSNPGNVEVLVIAEFLIGLGIGAMLLIIPAFIAGAIGSVEAFVLAFGMLVTLKFGFNIVMMPISTYLYTASLLEDPVGFFTLVSTPIIVGTLLLLPVKSCLFYESPPLRETPPQPAKYRSPVITFFLFVVPFYYIFWFVKIHAEIRTFTQSPTLLTPKCAGWSMFLLPFFVAPIIVSRLSDNQCTIIESNGQVPRYKTWLVVLFAFLLLPLSAALIQAQMNEISGNLGQKAAQ
ncbi:MFS transporter [Serratia sp. DD3]|uniref:MFS transporter n=1 Tax=Serratia sp. DD3 TaxID=1410619 RepID=UPI0003C5125F|nr:MFS transporter [Serratia sp. DD3]KEY60640.1 hypothetical protein SRDD_05380 [Serratia sp. DD3]